MNCRYPVFALLLVVPMLLIGCDFWDSGPDVASLKLSGKAGMTVKVVTSQKFIAQRDTYIDSRTGLARDTILVNLLSSDTTSVTLPFEQVYDISKSQQIVIRVLRPRPLDDALKAFMHIDGELKFASEPRPSDSQVQFLYIFQKGRVRPKPDA